jgi:drug/metabolite transporter (DMT)-like permease
MKAITGFLWVPQVLLIMVAMAWGSSYGLSKQALSYVPVMTFLIIRFTLTLLLLLPLVWRRLKIIHFRLLLPTGLLLLAIFLCETYGVSKTSASSAAFLISLFVIFTPLADYLINGIALRPVILVSAFMSLCGVYLLTGMSVADRGVVGIFHSVSFNVGDTLMIGAAILRGVIVVKTKHVLTEHASHIGAVVVSFVQSFYVLLGLMLALALLNQGQVVIDWPVSNQFWLYTFYLVIFCTLFAFVAQNYAASRLSATQVSFLTGLEPVFGAIFAYLLFGESLSVFQLLGGVLIVGSTLAIAGLQTSVSLATKATV